MATRNEKAPALLFENIAGDKSGSRVLANMLGSSKERYALAVGLDPDLSIAEMIAESRTIMNRKIAPVRIPKSKAPVNEVVLTRRRHRPHPISRRRNSGRATAAATSAPATSR